MAGWRLDQALADLLPEYSRARLQEWIRGGQARLNGQNCRPRDKIYGGEQVEITPLEEDLTSWQAQEMPLQLLYEDEELIVIDKPAGQVVHPGAGNPDQTMINALLHHEPRLAQLPRAGIIHRLDKDTSGVLVVARTLRSHHALTEQLQARDFLREYQAVVQGVLTGGGTVDMPIGRHPAKRVCMAVTPSGKPSVTHYRVVRRFRAHTSVRVQLETGRTHQIRVHLAYIHSPVAGDPVYGGRPRLPTNPSPRLMETLRQFQRQALHAALLGLQHPASGETMRWESPLPDDMQNLLDALREDAEANE
jgi:23S rRNA pseudouridine1911/1915/1917 synthase